MPLKLTRDITRSLQRDASRVTETSRGSAARRSRSSAPFVAPPLAWPVERAWIARGWKLRVAWAFNGALVVGGLLWLSVLLRAYDVDDGRNLDAFWKVYALALTQGLLVSDTVKVVLITFISPPFWARILKPGTRRATVTRLLLRMPLSAMLRI